MRIFFRSFSKQVTQNAKLFYSPRVMHLSERFSRPSLRLKFDEDWSICQTQWVESLPIHFYKLENESGMLFFQTQRAVSQLDCLRKNPVKSCPID